MLSDCNIFYKFIGVGIAEAFHFPAADADIVEDNIIDRTVSVITFQRRWFQVRYVRAGDVPECDSGD